MALTSLRSLFASRPEGWSAEREERFHEERLEAGLPRTRWVLTLILLVMLLPLLEMPTMRATRTEDAIRAFLWLRFGVLPVLAVMIGLSWVKSLRPWLSDLMAVGLVISCTLLAISAQLLNPVVVSPFGRITSSALPLMIAGVVLLPLRLRSALYCVTGGSLGVLASMFFLSEPALAPHLMVSAVLVLFALGLAVAIAVANRDGAARELFMQRERLAVLNTELQAANERLALVSGQKSDFLAMAAHELRSPLLVASLTTDQLLTGEPPSTAALDEGLGRISDVLGRMNDVLTSFLQSQAALDRSLARNDQPIRLADCAAAAIRRAEPIASRKQQTLRGLVGESNPIARGDASLLAQVLDNLLSNASKFSPAGATIEVRVVNEPAAGRAGIGITDAGPGVTAADRELLFQKYSRLSAKPTAGESSTGLGLSIVKLLMDAMGGEVRCENNASGGGATFWVHLPLTKSS